MVPLESSSQVATAIWPHVSESETRRENYKRIHDFFNAQITSVANQNQISIRNLVGSVTALLAILANKDPDPGTKEGFLVSARGIAQNLGMSSNLASKILALTLRISSTLDIQLEVPELVSPTPNANSITWTGRSTLPEAISVHFRGQSQGPLDMKSGKLDPRMTVAFLSNHRNLTVFWTSNLAEHLSIDWKHRVITIYEHKLFLWNHLKSPNNTLIPRDILGEAIDTMNLLFPLNDSRTRDFLTEHGKPFYGLGYCNREPCYDIDRFSYWRDRIASLVDVMNEGPSGIQQLKLSGDGRNLLQFLTFWMATAVAVLTIVSIVFGTVGMVYSVKQYNLQVAQACATPGAAELLPYYCS